VEQQISLVTLWVDDLRRARSFYEALGWTGAHQPDDEVFLSSWWEDAGWPLDGTERPRCARVLVREADEVRQMVEPLPCAGEKRWPRTEESMATSGQKRWPLTTR
jgi:catechol 2,3-dioxygenase-like lactoylglutathione lyase family enzyme